MIDDPLPPGRSSTTCPLVPLIDSLRYHSEAIYIEGGSTTGPFVPFAAEQDAIGIFNSLRFAQFSAGRHFARLALRHLGLSNAAIPFDLNGVPIWPEGVSGSIAHKNSFSLAAVAHLTKHPSLGVDLERDEPRDEDAISRTIALPQELAQKPLFSDLGLLSPCTGLLSAKEATFKAAFPTLRLPIDWLDIQINMMASGSFHAAIGEGRGWSGCGFIATQNRWIATLAWSA